MITARMLVVASLLLPGASFAQQLSLNAIDSLASAGQVGAARTAVDEWWRARAGEASREELQRALWLRGKLSLDAERAERDYQRLVLEFPGGPYTDGALVRLGTAAQARGDYARAVTYFETLLRDYPSSGYRLEATRWLERLRGAGAARAGARRSGGERDAPEAGRAAAAEGREGGYAVQLGAFSTLERAHELAARGRTAGLDVRVVRVAGSPLVRVRVGRFATQDAAAAARGEIVRKGFEAAVVSDAAAEERIP